jgi:hypothetical protein
MSAAPALRAPVRPALVGVALVLLAARVKQAIAAIGDTFGEIDLVGSPAVRKAARAVEGALAKALAAQVAVGSVLEGDEDGDLEALQLTADEAKQVSKDAHETFRQAARADLGLST